ncbi:carboxynorspermidine decarboxylase [Saccharicrinis sp. FJH62]|uniref:carboxynorspermidine decarboxylase n=1 Tax=Saccharicrinis sp. FJH62 TaxID=3344657 RepID=UPI0035D4B591
MTDYSSIPSPCFVLEETRFRKNLQLIADISKAADVEFILAFKAFSMWSAFPIVREYVKGATASSVFEAQLCFEEMKSLAHTYSPVYSEKDIDKILEYSSHITFNSVEQVKRFMPKINSADHKISCGLRVNPEYSEVETALYNPCSPGSRLGVTADQLKDGLPDGIEGLHFHALCESNSFDLKNTLNALEMRFGHLFGRIKWINMGGGHLVSHKDYDTNHLIETLKDFKARTGLKVIMEPGSAFAWETGFLKTTVEDIVQNKGIKTAIIDASFTCHMPDCLEMPYKPKIRGAYHEPVKGKPTYRIGGNSCLAGDFMGDWSFDKPLMIGDTLIFEDMIHYTMVKTTMFNGVPHPSIGIIHNDENFELIRTFNYQDFKSRLS